MKTTLSLPSYGRRETVAFPLAHVLSTTRVLCCQIFEEAKKFCFQTGVKVDVVYGGAPIYPQLRNLERGVDNLVATPGRLADMIERSKVSLAKIKYLALDEAGRMLDMEFEPQIRKIVERLDMPPCGRRQTMLFSATFPSEIQRMASDFLKNYIFLSVGRVGSSTDLILQKIVFVEDLEKREYLRNLLHDQKAKANLGKKTKSNLKGKEPCVRLKMVYVYRIERTGQAGKSGLATAFVNAKNSIVAKPISELMKEAHQDAPDWLDQYAESHSPSNDSRRGSSKFGSRDFRSGNDGSYGNEDYSATAAYGGNADYGGVSDSYGGYGGTSGRSALHWLV
ncbi:putative RNA helicase [Helianthus anomalus]